MSAAPQYKFTYFDGTGRGEVCRYLFSIAGVEYESVRITIPEWFAADHAKNTPFGALPTLEVEGVMLCQQNTIIRFLARRFGLGGKTDVVQAQAEMLLDCLNDILTPLEKVLDLKYAGHDESGARKELDEKFLPRGLKNIEEMLLSNDGGRGWFAGDEMTFADIALAHWLECWPKVAGSTYDVAEQHPALVEHQQRVFAEPRVAAWREKRPKTEW